MHLGNVGGSAGFNDLIEGRHEWYAGRLNAVPVGSAGAIVTEIGAVSYLAEIAVEIGPAESTWIEVSSPVYYSWRPSIESLKPETLTILPICMQRMLDNRFR